MPEAPLGGGYRPTYDRYNNPYNPAFSQPGIPSVSNDWSPNPGEAAPQPGGGGGGGGTGPGPGRNVGGWSGILDWGVPGAPRFNAPRFAAPSLQDAMNEPGYAFRLKTGTDALEKSAAARGTLRTGGTLKDIMSYGQNFATQEYNNVFRRAMDAFDRNYRAAYDEYQPLKDEWKEQAQAEKIKALETYNKNYGAWELAQHNSNQANNAYSNWLMSQAG